MYCTDWPISSLLAISPIAVGNVYYYYYYYYLQMDLSWSTISAVAPLTCTNHCAVQWKYVKCVSIK